MPPSGHLHLHQVAVDGAGDLAGLRRRFAAESSDADRRARFERDRNLLCGHERLVGAGNDGEVVGRAVTAGSLAAQDRDALNPTTPMRSKIRK